MKFILFTFWENIFLFLLVTIFLHDIIMHHGFQISVHKKPTFMSHTQLHIRTPLNTCSFTQHTMFFLINNFLGIVLNIIYLHTIYLP